MRHGQIDVGRTGQELIQVIDQVTVSVRVNIDTLPGTSATVTGRNSAVTTTSSMDLEKGLRYQRG